MSGYVYDDEFVDSFDDTELHDCEDLRSCQEIAAEEACVPLWGPL